MTPAERSATNGHRPPRDCPVCGTRLQVTRLGCGSCGTELSGVFEPCDFCGLTDAERGLLHVFLTSRGNMREVERYLAVSYPTARQRYTDLLVKLGLEAREPTEDADQLTRDEVLSRLARGEIDVDTAEAQLRVAAGDG